MAFQAKLQLILGGFFYLYKLLLMKTNLNWNLQCQCSDKVKNVEVLREVKSQPKIREVPKEFQIALFIHTELKFKVKKIHLKADVNSTSVITWDLEISFGLTSESYRCCVVINLDRCHRQMMSKSFSSASMFGRISIRIRIRICISICFNICTRIRIRIRIGICINICIRIRIRI